MKKPTCSTAKGMLSLIDKFLSNENISEKERRNLWDVLSALRGPDMGRDTTKYATTSVVRKTAFPNSFTEPYRFSEDMFSGTRGSLGALDTSERAEYRKSFTHEKEGEHFSVHVKDAFKALGLKWEEKN